MRLLVALVVAVCGFAAQGHATEPSPGCGVPAGPPPTRFEIEGKLRRAIVVLPADYDPERTHALVVAFHGRTNDNARVRRYFGLEESAYQPTIHVYPAGLADRTGAFTWHDPGDPATALRDFAFFDTILARLAAAYCIDLDAVFVVGHSLGASFANSLACARADRIRGLASVAGGIAPQHCEGEVAALLLHNPADRAVPIGEGRRARDVLLGDPLELRASAAQRLGPFACEAYRDGADPLLWCAHHQSTNRFGRHYPHQWPRGAGEAIMGFFAMLEE
jgi:polyhydroxybutyrate depolymerase